MPMPHVPLKVLECFSIPTVIPTVLPAYHERMGQAGNLNRALIGFLVGSLLEMGIVLSLCCCFARYLFPENHLRIVVKNVFNIMTKSGDAHIVVHDRSNTMVQRGTRSNAGCAFGVGGASVGRQVERATNARLFGSVDGW
jgi:hypothetical protein